MATLDDPAVKALLDAPNYAVISTFNPDGSMHSTVVWQEVVDGALSMNSAVGRHWPSNLDADPRVTVLVMAQGNPYEYEIRGTAIATTDGVDAQIDRLAKKYPRSGSLSLPGGRRAARALHSDSRQGAPPETGMTHFAD